MDDEQRITLIMTTATGLLEDLEQLQRCWPKSKRGSRAQAYLDSIILRANGIKDDAAILVVSDLRAARAAIEGEKK